MSFYPDGQPKIPNQTPIPAVRSLSDASDLTDVSAATDGALPQGPVISAQAARTTRRTRGLLRIVAVEFIVLASMVVAVFLLGVVPVETGIWFIVAAGVVGAMTLSSFLMRSMQADRAEILAENQAAAAAHRSGPPVGTPVSVRDALVPGASFEMPVEDVFAITGRWTVATGRVSLGEIRVGQVVAIVRGGQIVGNARIGGIEAFREVKEAAVAGEMVGLVLDGVARDAVARGDVVVTAN